MFHVVLYQPEIPPNTGNIIRLCANTGCTLHLIQPLGFRLDDRDLRRAGLDYHEYAELRVHASYPDWRATHAGSVWAFTKRATRAHTGAPFASGDALLFGPESRGLPAGVLDATERSQRLRIPMRAGSRSLNLSNAVAVAVYEAWRQHDFGK